MRPRIWSVHLSPRHYLIKHALSARRRPITQTRQILENIKRTLHQLDDHCHHKYLIFETARSPLANNKRKLLMRHHLLMPQSPSWKRHGCSSVLFLRSTSKGGSISTNWRGPALWTARPHEKFCTSHVLYIMIDLKAPGVDS